MSFISPSRPLSLSPFTLLASSRLTLRRRPQHGSPPPPIFLLGSAGGGGWGGPSRGRFHTH